jgi:RNA polymerase-binding transcription factor DksA
MGRRKTVSRARQRQERLRELAGDEAVCAVLGNGYSRAAEAIDALRRIQDGTYGVCSDCGRRIPAARLEIKPESARCVACQTEYERQWAAPIGD